MLAPALSSGLPVSGARVRVVPPLFCSGPSIGLAGLAAVPVMFGADSPSRSATPTNDVDAVSVPADLRTSLLVAGAVPVTLLSATTVLSSEMVPDPEVSEMPPPPLPPAVFPVTVLFWTIAVPEKATRAIPPPVPAAVFPCTVLFWTRNPNDETVP